MTAPLVAVQVAATRYYASAVATANSTRKIVIAGSAQLELGSFQLPRSGWPLLL